MRAINNVGLGYFSDPDSLVVRTDDVPGKMPTPTLDPVLNILYNQINITWAGLLDANMGGDPVVYHSLEWDEGDSTKDLAVSWTELTNPADFNVTLTTKFVHDMSPRFPNNTVLRYRTRAKNGVGFGNYSDPLVITTDRAPLIMATPTNGTVKPKSIKVYWTFLTGLDSNNNDNNGRSPLTNYKLECNTGSGWETIKIAGTNVNDYTHKVSDNFPANVDRSPYYIKYRVSGVNDVGDGIPSLELLVASDTYPK